MAWTSRVTHLLHSSLGTRLAVLAWAWVAACSPLTATIGYEDQVEREAAVEPADASGPGPGLDASTPSLADASSIPDATPSEAPDARSSVRCWHLPDVVNARNEAGIERVDEGEVFGATDKTLGCLEGGVPVGDPVPITYERRDGMPLFVASRSYSLTAPIGPLAFAINAFAAARCQQTPLPFFVSSSSLGPLCSDMADGVGAQALRLLLSNQTQLPHGIKLCEAKCAAVPP